VLSGLIPLSVEAHPASMQTNATDRVRLALKLLIPWLHNFRRGFHSLRAGFETNVQLPISSS
ncbi:hypothetical protein AB4Y38_43125, partial [Paraburkholderia sp. EG285A]|uniref:hypothetical protein n=1 Tax=Paraburkholderia sp. EG285A TaxID=3237009 RepID=UPI0034D287B1